MKNVISVLLLMVVLFSAGTASVQAEAAPNDVYVTIANGDLVLVQEAVSLRDVDEDGALTVNDALYLAHEAAYEGGAAAGYAFNTTEWGLSLMKLWGVENGGSYGYYINHTASMGLADPVEAGDFIHAFVYSDTDTFSDVYTYFDKDTAIVEAGAEVTLKLLSAGYDENWAPVEKPVADAVILLDGEETSYRTDASGSVTISFDEGGEYVISAASDASTLVPPVCVATVSGGAESSLKWLIIGAVAGVCTVLCFRLLQKNKKSNDSAAA